MVTLPVKRASRSQYGSGTALPSGAEFFCGQGFPDGLTVLLSRQSPSVALVPIYQSPVILKQLHDLGDETVVETWRENSYWQYFCGEAEMQWGAPCEPSDLVHFRHRIGEAGMQLILAVSIQLHGPKGGEKEVVIDTTVQEKNVTHPTDTKLYRKVIARCWKLADREQIQLRRR